MKRYAVWFAGLAKRNCGKSLRVLVTDYPWSNLLSWNQPATRASNKGLPFQSIRLGACKPSRCCSLNVSRR